MGDKRQWFHDRVNILNVILVAFAAAGAIVMVLALTATVTSVIKNHGVAKPYPSPISSTRAPADSGIPSGPVTEDRLYTFSKKSDLKAFKAAGYGTVIITKGKRLKIVSDPATKKRVSITVHVDGGSTVSFDDEQVGDIDYDATNFYIDGYSGVTTSGTRKGSAKYQVYTLTPGKHTLTWQFFTDTTYNAPTDAYYLDNIKITKVLRPGWY